MVSPHIFTFPLYLPRICRLLRNWHEYCVNYVLRRKIHAEYYTRSGLRLIDRTGSVAGTIAVVFVRREYGSVDDFTTVVDIGANVGCFALFAAASCPTARVLCYEPEERNFDLLRQNIAANELGERIIPFNAAVAPTPGFRDLALGDSPLHSFHVRTPAERHQTVRCVTLRDIINDNGLITVDLLKLNCEGAEYEILDACSQSDFRRITNIRLEYHNLPGSANNGESLVSLLQTRGYRIERFSRYRLESGFIWATRATVGAQR